MEGREQERFEMVAMVAMVEMFWGEGEGGGWGLRKGERELARFVEEAVGGRVGGRVGGVRFLRRILGRRERLFRGDGRRIRRRGFPFFDFRELLPES